MMMDRIQQSKTLNEVKPVKNINKNLPNFLDIGPMQEEVLPSHKPEDYAYK